MLNKKLLFGGIATLGFLAVIAFGGGTTDRDVAIASAKRYLIDSDSAKFGEFYALTLGTGCMEVNSKNRFGGYTGWRSAQFEKQGSNWVFRGESDSSCSELKRRL